jgi:hypothetical protein
LSPSPFLLAGTLAFAQDDDLWHPPPDRLTIGYEGESKVDISPQACEAFVGIKRIVVGGRNL